MKHQIEEFDIINYIDMTEEQSSEVWRVRNLPEIRCFMTTTEVFSLESHHKFIETLKTSKTKLYWAIFKDNDLIGTYNVIDIKDNSCDYGLFISPKYWGNQYAEMIGNAMFRLLREKYNVNTIRIEIKSDNIKSINVHKKMGFQMVENGEIIKMNLHI